MLAMDSVSNRGFFQAPRLRASGAVCPRVGNPCHGRTMSTFELGGLIAAPYTPFDGAGGLNLAVIERQAASLAAAGVKGAFVCGTTGEGLSMTTAERMDVSRRWVEVTRGGGLKIVVHVGHNAQGDAMALAAHAREIGADAVAALPPFFFKPGRVEQVVEFMRPVAAATGDLPFYYY